MNYSVVLWARTQIRKAFNSKQRQQSGYIKPNVEKKLRKKENQGGEKS